MLRRCLAMTAAAATVTSRHDASGGDKSSSCVHNTALQLQQRRGLFGGWGKGGAAADGNNNTSSNSSSSSSNFGLGGMPKLPSPFDLGRMKQMRDMLNKMPVERQKELLNELMGMQSASSTDKKESLMQRMQRSAQAMEKLLKQAEEQSKQSSSSAAATATPTSSSSASLWPGSNSATTTTTSGSRGPTLEQLRAVNLGSELEALFAELASMRAKKNDYRSRLAAAQETAQQTTAEAARLRASEADLRARLHRAEHQTMLLTSENVELSEKAKLVKELTRSLHATQQQLRQLQKQSSSAEGGVADAQPSRATLQQQLQSKDAALRSLQRKLERMRRRDPLLQFSLACSDVRRLCAAMTSSSSSSSSNGSGAAAGMRQVDDAAAASVYDEDSDTAFARLRSAYEAQQHEAWAAAARSDAAAARAYVAVLRACVRVLVPYAHYDAVVTLAGDVDAARAFFAEAGFVVTSDDCSNNNSSAAASTTAQHQQQQLCVCAREEAAPLHQQPGPYGYLAALQMAMPPNVHTTASARNNNNSNSTSDADELLSTVPFTIVHVQPCVSPTLLRNGKRSVVTYDTARASGPGGQAVNVSETQVYARLAIDDVPAYTAEAQDSRSALSNRHAALERLQTTRWQQHNETVARQQRVEDVYARLVRAAAQHGGVSVPADVRACVREARDAHALPCLDVALVCCIERLARDAAAAAAATGNNNTTATATTARGSDDGADATATTQKV